MSEFVDPFRGRFLDSSVPAPETPQFAALGHAGSSVYAGLEKFPNPGCGIVTYESDEVMAVCPITGQPDFYKVTIQLRDPEFCVESKSLKLFFQNIMRSSFTENTGIFCESLAVHVRNEVSKALELDEDRVLVQLTQKSRGGISITAVA